MKLLKRMLPGQAGQALPMALVLLFLGAMLIVPALSLTTTNLKATQSVDEKTRELYAADAGIEDALWHLQSEERFKIKDDNEDGHAEYGLSDNVNAKSVSVAIDTTWLLSDMDYHLDLPQDEPSAGPPPSYYYANDHWTVVSALNVDARDNYIVDITTNEDAEATYVNHIAVWLPRGYSCNTTSVTINGVAIGEEPNGLVKEPSPISHRGGTALIWDYSGTTFKQLSDIAPGGEPPVAKFPASIRLSFNYNVTPFTEARGFFPWIQLFGGRIAWDADTGFYHIESTGITSPTDNTTVEAYVPKGVRRYVSGSSGATSSIQGDYIAIGNSLMTCCWNETKDGPPAEGQSCYTTSCSCCNPSSNNPYRNYAPYPQEFTPSESYPDAERESYATVDSGNPDVVPDDAQIERAYLYWTAWLRGKDVWQEKRTDPWQWDNCMDISSDNDRWETCTMQTTPTVAEVNAWLEANAYDGNAYLAVNDTKVEPVNPSDPDGTVLANTWYISKGSFNVQPSYQYSCFADVTAQIKDITTTLPGTKFTVAGVHAHPSRSCGSDNEFSYSPNAGWSMVIIYSSSEKKTHQIYLYQGCDHLYSSATKEFTITGFATPLAEDLELGETNEAKMTVFASDGDGVTAAEYLGFKGQNTGYYQLYDVSNTTNVFNSKSAAGGFDPSDIPTCQGTTEISGIDIDTYTYTHATEPPSGIPLYTIVHSGDISANIKAQSTGDGFMLIYVVFTVRSTAVPAGEEFNVGSMMYRIE